MANMKFKIGDKVKVVNPAHTWKKKYLNDVFTIDRYNPNGETCFNEPHYGVSEKCGYVWQESELELVTDEKIVITHNGKVTTATLYGEFGSKVTATARCAPEDDFNFRIGAEIAMGRLVDKLVFARYNVVRVVFREGERPYSYKTSHQTAKVGMKIVVPVGAYGKKVNATVVEIIPGAEYDGDYTMSAMKEIDIVEVPQYYNGKVVCISNRLNDREFTIGKIYEIKNGKFIDNQGMVRPGTIDKVTSLDDLKKGYFSQWYYKFIPIVE